MIHNRRTSILYILPQYDPATASHFFYLYELLERAAKELDIFLIIEKTKACPKNLPLKVYCQKFSWPPLRLAELLFIVFVERMRGIKHFYTHYSFFGAIVSWFATALFGGRSYYWNAGAPWQYRRGFFREAAFRFILRHTTLVTGTKGLAEEYQRRYNLRPDKLRVMPNWIAVDRFQDKSKQGLVRRRLNVTPHAKLVLFVHRLSRRKGAHRILPVAAAVTKKAPDAIFLIVGSGPEYDNLKFEIRNWKLEKNVRLIGEVANRDVPVYFQAADVLFMPSEEEGFPHVLIEAMAAGVPYVASDVGGVREITPPDLREYVLSEGDVGAFSEKIIKLLTMAEEGREKIVRSEKEWVRQYDINAVLPKFIGLFQ